MAGGEEGQPAKELSKDEHPEEEKEKTEKNVSRKEPGEEFFSF